MAAMLGCLVMLPAGWRELSIAVIATASFWFTPAEIRQRNEFSFAPLKEIAWIFLGIFATLIPVLDYMERHAADLGLHSDTQFYWTTGALSAVLDNAPAYLAFLSAGGSKYPIDLLKDAGVDMTTNEPLQLTMQKMNRVMDEMEKLLGTADKE